MLKPKVGFIVYGVHKDGLQDPMGQPFIDDQLVAASRAALESAGLELVEYETVIASKPEARDCFDYFKKRDDIDAVVLYSGTWVWAAHLAAAVRDFSFSQKGVALWTHPGSQGWRPVGGLVMHGALKEIGIEHRFVYGDHRDADEVGRIVAWCRASAERRRLNGSTLGVFGGRGMGQTCGVADPSQWMRMFGIDIDTRDTYDLVQTARSISSEQIEAARSKLQPLFRDPVPADETANRSIALYLALRQVIEREQWDFYSIQSFPGMGDYYGATCFAQSMMLNDGFGTSTLSDFNTALSVKLMTDFSEEPVYYGDLQHIDKKKNEVKIIGDGACPPSLANAAGAGFAGHGIPTEGEAGGLSVDLVCKEGRGVLARVGRQRGEFEMLIAPCRVFEPSEQEIKQRREECGIPFWPHAFLEVEGDMDGLVQGWNNEYGCLCYGAGVYADLLAFCEQTGIRAVCPA